MERFREVLNNRQPHFYNMRGIMVSAVLLPLLEICGELQILFEVRALHLKRQPGEICFPGGRVEPEEMSRPQDAAIRETFEEINVPPESVDLIGPLDYFISPIGSLIYPFLGKLNINELPKPNPDEVQEVFLVPLSFLLNAEPDQSKLVIGTCFAEDFPFHRLPDRYQPGWRLMGSSPVYFYQYGDRLIWGATAGILHSFLGMYRKISKAQE